MIIWILSIIVSIVVIVVSYNKFIIIGYIVKKLNNKIRE